MPRAIVLDERDNVANLIGAAKAGEVVEVHCMDAVQHITLMSDIPANHKFATREIRAGELVIKYGHPIGRATQDIQIGEHVHVHNVESLRARADLEEAKGGKV